MKINLEILDAFYLYHKNSIEDLNTKELVPQMMLRRRLTKASKLVIEALAKIDAKNSRIVYGSSFGELATSANILKAILEDDMLSPTDFQNSVYNTAVSYASILFENKNEMMTISSGDNTSLKVLKAGAIKAMDKDEIVLVCSETLNIENIEEIGTCVDYLECIVALKVKITNKDSNIKISHDNLDGFPNPIKDMLSIAKNFDRKKINIISIDL